MYDTAKGQPTPGSANLGRNIAPGVRRRGGAGWGVGGSRVQNYLPCRTEASPLFSRVNTPASLRLHLSDDRPYAVPSRIRRLALLHFSCDKLSGTNSHSNLQNNFLG